jgi:hypothetical protein
MKPKDDRYSPPPGHKEGTCQDDPILVMLADQRSNICYMPLLGTRNGAPHGDPLWSPHLAHHTFTNNTAVHTFVYFAGRNNHAQRRSFYLAEGSEGHSGSCMSSEISQSEAAPLADMHRVVIGAAQKSL